MVAALRPLYRAFAGCARCHPTESAQSYALTSRRSDRQRQPRKAGERAEAAGLFADKLYERLAQGAPTLEAYRHARSALRQARPQDASWASFVYYGPTR